MIHILRELYSVLPRQEQTKILMLQIFVIIGAIFELVGVVSILPFMSLLGSQSSIDSDSLLMFVYRYLNLSTVGDLYIILGALSFFALLSSSLVVFWVSYKTTRYGLELSQRLSNQLFSFYLSRNWEEVGLTNSGQLIKNISTELGRVTNSVIRPFFQLNGRLASFAFIVVGLMVYEPWITLSMTATFAGAYFIFYRTFKGILTRNGEIISRNLTIRFETLNEGFGGIKDILMTDTADKFVGDFKRSNREIFKASLSSFMIEWSPRYLLEIVAFGSILGLTVGLVWREAADLSTVLPTLSIFALAGLKLLPSIQQIYGSLSLMKSGLPAFEVLKDDLRRSFSEVEAVAPVSCHELSGKITADEVNFSYPSRKNFQLRDVTFEIPAKQCVGFIGKTGSGKTTLISLLAGLVIPRSGRIYFDDLELTESNAAAIRGAIGYVSQDAFVLDATIEQNIAFGVEQGAIQRTRVLSAIRDAQLTEFVESLDNGLETVVGERGVQISGGQRQRLAIARALYRDARILIFDEATSALDRVTESSIMEAIDSMRGERTMIIVAHRLNTLKKCDRLYLVDDGKLVADGTFDQLSATQGFFSDLRGPG